MSMYAVSTQRKDPDPFPTSSIRFTPSPRAHLRFLGRSLGLGRLGIVVMMVVVLLLFFLLLLVLVLVLLNGGLGDELLKDEVVALFFGGTLGLDNGLV
jgi:hypothetical protein